MLILKTIFYRELKTSNTDTYTYTYTPIEESDMCFYFMLFYSLYHCGNVLHLNQYVHEKSMLLCFILNVAAAPNHKKSVCKSTH